MSKGWISIGATCLFFSFIWFFSIFGQYSGQMFTCFFWDAAECRMARGFSALIGGSSGSFHPWLTWLGCILLLIGFFKPSDENGIKKTKKCPSCAELINFDASKCRYCGEKFNINEQVKQAQYQEMYDDFKCPKCSADIDRIQDKCNACNFDLTKFMH